MSSCVLTFLRKFSTQNGIFYGKALPVSSCERLGSFDKSSIGLAVVYNARPPYVRRRYTSMPDWARCLSLSMMRHIYSREVHSVTDHSNYVSCTHSERGTLFAKSRSLEERKNFTSFCGSFLAKACIFHFNNQLPRVAA